MNYKLIVDKRRGKDVYPSTSGWEYVVLDGGALKVSTAEKRSMGHTVTMYAPGEWKRTRKLSDGSAV